MPPFWYKVRITMIDAHELTRRFGDTTAVDSLSFNVEEGEIFGFLGPNGAGKTTTVRMLCCLISSSSGSVRIAGHDAADASESLRIRKLIGLVPDNVGLYEELTAYENLDFYGRLYETPDPQRRANIESYLRMMDLWERKDRPAGEFSKGMKQKLALARALVHEPQLLFFDEPTANLDPESTKVVRDLILELKQHGKTIFLNTHDLDEAQRICDRIGIINTKLLAINTPEQLKQSLWGSKTVIQLERVNDSLVAAVKQLGVRNISVEGNRLVIDVDQPEKENPALVGALIAAGGNIQFVTQVNPDLEEAYLKIVKDSE